MTPGTGQHHGPVPGYRPEGSARNGLTAGAKPYQYKGTPGWNPAQGVHRNAADVMPRPGAAGPQGWAATQSQEKDARVAEFTRLRAIGLTYAQIAAEMGVSDATVKSYGRQARERGGRS
jgi:hypothetical protein